jgi:hypothetical protein
MRYMRWSYDQLMGCPADYVDVIVEENRRENAESKSTSSRRAPTARGRR